MKTIIGVIILVGVMWGAVHLMESEPLEYNKVETTLEVIEVKEAWMTDEDAVKAAQDVIKKKELQAELTALEASFASSTEVYKAEEKAYKAKKVELEKELGTYWTRENIKTMIRQVFPEDSQTAIAVASCESGLKPSAFNGSNNNGSTDGGLWQINTVHDKELQRLGLDKFDPEDATEFARILYEKNGWMDWVCFWSPKHMAMNS